MFGFARVRQRALINQEWHLLKKHYCGLCHALREDYSLLAGGLTGWDGRFLALLVEAQFETATMQSKTKCPAALGMRQNGITNYGIATRYAAAVTIYLLGEKLKDNIRDDASKLSQMLKATSESHFERAAEVLTELDFPLELVENFRKKQYLIESTERSWSLEEVTSPSAMAVSLIFAHTANLTQRVENNIPLARIGHCVGRIVTLLDACQDYIADTKKGRFNSIASTLSKDEERLPFTMHRFNLLKSYLLVQLREIRFQITNLVLYRNTGVIENILVLGLYDITMNVCEQFASSVCQPESISDLASTACPHCKREVFGYFCTHCGTSLNNNAISNSEEVYYAPATVLPNL